MSLFMTYFIAVTFPGSKIVCHFRQFTEALRSMPEEQSAWRSKVLQSVRYGAEAESRVNSKARTVCEFKAYCCNPSKLSKDALRIGRGAFIFI